MSDLAECAYAIHARLSNIGPQRGKGGREIAGPASWETLPAHFKRRWEIFAAEFAREIDLAREKRMQDILERMGATVER